MYAMRIFSVRSCKTTTVRVLGSIFPAFAGVIRELGNQPVIMYEYSLFMFVVRTVIKYDKNLL